MTRKQGTCYWTGSEWEWENIYEPDGTPDSSPLTSIDTDMRKYTSPSDGPSSPSQNTLKAKAQRSNSHSHGRKARKASSLNVEDYPKRAWCRNLRTRREGPCYWSGSKWEWENKYEPDGTPDSSRFTSVDTDL
jgi:hypothetical protein